MSRNLIKQLEQILGSETYNDQIANVASGVVSESTTSLEEDLNIIRTLLKLIKGTDNWYSDLGNYFDPSNTNDTNDSTKSFNLYNIKNNHLDAKTAIVPVTIDNDGYGYSISGTQTGILMDISSQYATASDRRGLPIYGSSGILRRYIH